MARIEAKTEVTGLVALIESKVGDRIAAGDPVLLIDSMTIQTPVLVGQTGTLQEVGGLTGQGRYVDGRLVGVTPAPYVMGLAAIDGRPVAVGGEDFTVRGGTSWSGDRKKGGQGGFIEDLAASYRIPLINLI